MTIFHSFADQPTIDFVEGTPDLKKLLTELNHRYNIVACNKGQDSKAVSLVWPNLMFVGFAWISQDSDDEGNDKKAFCIESTLLEKERGRGRNRYVRKSEKLTHLIKIIDAKFRERIESFTKQPGTKVTGARSSVYSMIENKLTKKSHASILSGSEEYELLKSCLMGDPMPQYLRDKAADALTKHTQREKENLERERSLKKFDHVHILWGSTTTPVCYGVAKLVNQEYEIQGEMKPCFDERDLPDDFAVHLKMHKISKEHVFKAYPASGFTPMHSSFLKTDAYDEDFDTVSYYGLSDAQRGIKYIYVTPVQSDAN